MFNAVFYFEKKQTLLWGGYELSQIMKAVRFFLTKIEVGVDNLWNI